MAEPTGTLPSPANLAALARVRMRAEQTRDRDVARIRRALDAAGLSADVDELCAGLRRIASVTINFHPDRMAADGRSVAEALAEGGAYRSQFETRISNGGLTAYPGGDRDRWEQALFGGAYQADGVNPTERPRYGGLDFLAFENGACPRFGSCHLRLRPAALDRSTFFVGDSVDSPEDGGTIDRLEPVLAGLLESVAEGDSLGRRLTVDSLVGWLRNGNRAESITPTMNRALDGYVEAQIHGPVALGVDVQSVGIDPSFRATPAGEALLTAALRYGVGVEWHAGSRLTADEIPTEAPLSLEPSRWGTFCSGGRAAQFAQAVVGRFGDDQRMLDAATIGRAAASVVREPEAWRRWDDTEDPLTRLKDLWLILVVYGRPVVEGR